MTAVDRRGSTHVSHRRILVLVGVPLVAVATVILWVALDSRHATAPEATLGAAADDQVIGLEHLGDDPVPFPTGMASGFQGCFSHLDDLTATTLTVHSGLDLDTDYVLTWNRTLALRVPENTIGLDSSFTSDPQTLRALGVQIGSDARGTSLLTITGNRLDDSLIATDKNAQLEREEITTLVNSIVFLDRPTAEHALATTPDVIRDTFDLGGVTITRQIGLPTSSVQIRSGRDARWNGAALSVLRDDLELVAKQLLTLDDGRIVVSHSPLVQPAVSTGAITVDDALLGLSWTIVDSNALHATDGGKTLDVVDADGNEATLTVVDYASID